MQPRMSALSDACIAINNAVRASKRRVTIQHTSKELKDFLLKMKEYGYISTLVFVANSEKEKTVLGLNGRLTKCGAIYPRFRYQHNQILGVANSLKPARQFGHVIFNSPRGIVDQEEANEKRTGGSIMGFFY